MKRRLPFPFDADSVRQRFVVGGLKVCPVCDTLNTEEASECFVCCWYGEFDFDPILVDLSDCEFIDSTGIAAIVHAHNEFAERGGQVAVYSPAAQVRRVLSVTGLTSNGLVFESIEEALSAFGSSA